MQLGPCSHYKEHIPPFIHVNWTAQTSSIFHLNSVFCIHSEIASLDLLWLPCSARRDIFNSNTKLPLEREQELTSLASKTTTSLRLNTNTLQAIQVLTGFPFVYMTAQKEHLLHQHNKQDQTSVRNKTTAQFYEVSFQTDMGGREVLSTFLDRCAMLHFKEYFSYYNCTVQLIFLG